VDLRSYFQQRKALVDKALDDILPKADNDSLSFNAAMRYSIFAGGKRVRPILAMEAAELVGGQASDVMLLAVALECIHTYSLIHDDLPAMDDDDLRRGKPTLHKIFGEAVAILVGDALLTLAFDVMSSPEAMRVYRPERLLKALSLLSSAAGCQGLIRGQYLDISMEGKTADETTVTQIVTGKTGALLKASLSCGALLAGGSPEEVRLLSCLGENLGMVFQIKDDLLDIEGNSKELGKAVRKDQNKGKVTFPALFGVDNAKDRMRHHLNCALGTLEPLGERALTLAAICRYVGNRIN
jgi:geranylgeranyl diphosphate synthase type II